ncbi:hypothetical protein ACTXT7_013657 [Hymenolepis weldensis]
MKNGLNTVKVDRQDFENTLEIENTGTLCCYVHVMVVALIEETGRTPEQADRVFLENVRRLALYGVHLHRVKVMVVSTCD